MSQRSVALRYALYGVGHQFLFGAAGRMVVYAHLVAAFAAQKPVDRHLEILARDIVQCNVDGGDGAHHCRSAKMGKTVQVLPVVLDVQRILSDKVSPHGQDGLG